MFTKAIRSPVAIYVAVATAGILVGAGGLALAAPSGGALHACASKRTGLLRLASRCTKQERAVAWNVQGPQGTKGQQGPQGMTGNTGMQGVPGTPATKLFASVMSNGTIDASSPGVQVYRQAMGVYQVNFGQDITHCAPIASIGGVPIYGSPGASTGAVEGYVKTNVFSPGSNFGGSGYPSGDTVSVDLYSGGTDLLVDTSFYIAVFC